MEARKSKYTTAVNDALKKYDATGLFEPIDLFKGTDPSDTSEVCEELNNVCGVCLNPRCSLNHHPRAVWAHDKEMKWTCWKKNINYVIWLLRYFHELPENLQMSFLPLRQQLVELADGNKVDQFIETYFSLHSAVDKFTMVFDGTASGSIPCKHILSGQVCDSCEYQHHPNATLCNQAEKLRNKILNKYEILQRWGQLCSNNELYRRWIFKYSSKEYEFERVFSNNIKLMKAICDHQRKAIEMSYLSVLHHVFSEQNAALKGYQLREEINTLRQNVVTEFIEKRIAHYTDFLSAFKLLTIEKTEKGVKVDSILKRRCYNLPSSKSPVSGKVVNKKQQVNLSVVVELDKTEVIACLRSVLLILEYLSPQKLDKLIEDYIRTNHPSTALPTLKSLLVQLLQKTLTLAAEFARDLMQLKTLDLKFKEDIKSFDELADKFDSFKSQLKLLRDRLYSDNKRQRIGDQISGEDMERNLLAFLLFLLAKDPLQQLPPVELDALIGVKKEEDDSSGDVQEDDKEDSLKGTHQLPPPPTTSTAKVVTVFDYCKYDLLMQNKKSMKGQVATTDFSWFSCSKCKKGRINLAAVETHFTSNIFDGHEINGAVCPHCHGNAKDLRICAVCYESNPQSDMFIGCEPCLSVYHECGESFDPPHPIDQWARFPQDFQYKIAENESHKTNDDPEGSNEYANCYYMRTIYLDVVIPLLVSACLILWREVNSKTCAVCKLQHDVSNLLVQCLRTPVMSYILAKEESFKKNGDKFLKDINSLYMSFRHFPEDTMELSADYLKRKLDVPALLDLMHALSPDRAEFLLSQEESEVLRKSRHDSFHVNTMTQILFSDYSAAIRKIVTTLLAKLHKARGRCDLIDIPSESSMLKTFDEASENVVAQPLKHHYRLQVARESERQTLSVVSELLRNEMLGQVGSNSLRIAKMICDTGYKSRLLYIPSLKASVDDESLSRLKYLISYCKWDTVVNSNEINHKVSVALNESFGAAYWKQKSIAYMGRSRGLNDNVTLRKHVYFSVVAAFGPLETDENSLRAIETVLFQLGFGQYPLEVKLEQLCLLATTGNELFASRVLSYIQPTAALQDTKHHSLDLPAIMIDMELVLAYLLPYHKELYGGIVLLPTLVDSSTVAFCTVSKDILVDFKDCLEVMHYGCHDYPTETSIASVRRALGCKEDTSVCDMLHKYPDTVLREEISHFLKGNPAPWYLFAHNRVISRQDLSTITFNRDGDLVKSEHRTFQQVLSDMTGKDLIIIRHGLGTGGRTLARHIAYSMHKQALCVVIKDLEACLQKNEKIRALIKQLHKRTGLKVVIIGEKPPHESLAGSFAQQLYESSATFILTTRIQESEISDLSARDYSNLSGSNSKPKRLVRTVFEIFVPSVLSESERLEFNERLCSRFVTLNGSTLTAEYFTGCKSVNVDQLLKNEKYTQAIKKCTDAKLLECGFAAFEVLALRRMLSSAEWPNRAMRTKSYLLPDTFWGMLLLFPDYRDTIQKIMRDIFQSEFSEEQRKLVILMTFYGIFSPNHAVPICLASYLLSVYTVRPGPLTLNSTLSSFMVVDIEQGVIQFRNYHMVYCWANILFDQHIGDSYGLQHITLVHELMNKDAEFCTDPAIVAALQSILCDFPLWHYLPVLSRLDRIATRDGSMIYEEKQNLRYSFFVEFLLGNDYAGFSLAQSIYEYVIKHLLDGKALDDDCEHRFPSSVRTHYARLLTRTAEVTKNRSLLKRAEEVLMGISKDNRNEQYFERKGSIERAKIRILQRELRSKLYARDRRDKASAEKLETELSRDKELFSLVTIAQDAARYYRNAMQVSRYSNPIPMLALISNWLDTLGVLRIVTAEDDYKRCFRQLGRAEIEEKPHTFSQFILKQLNELLCQIRGVWIFDQISSLFIMIRNTLVYLEHNTRVSSNRIRKDLSNYRLEVSKYQSDELSEIAKNKYTGPPYVWWIATVISEDKPLSEAKVQYSILTANDVANEVCRRDEETGRGSRINENFKLYVALELLFKLAVASHGLAHDMETFSNADNFSQYIWHNKRRMLSCVNQWYTAAQGKMKTSGEHAQRDYYYYGLTPVFGMYAHLIFTILNTTNQEEKLTAICDLCTQLYDQKGYRQWQFNTESRYYVTPIPSIPGLSFSQLIKSDTLFDQCDIGSFESFLYDLRRDERRNGLLKVFSGVREDTHFVCTELSGGAYKVRVHMQYADESKFNKGDKVTFILGMSGSQLRAHAVMSANVTKQNDLYEDEDEAY